MNRFPAGAIFLLVEFWEMNDSTYILHGNRIFFDFLEESMQRGRYHTLWFGKGKSRKEIFPSQSRSNRSFPRTSDSIEESDS